MMRKFITLVTIVLATLTVAPPAWAKKRKRRRRKKTSQTTLQQKESTATGLSEWEEKKAALKPEQLKDLIEENHRLKAQQEELANQAPVDEEELKQLRKLREKINMLLQERGLSESDGLEALFSQPAMVKQSQEGEHNQDGWAIDEQGRSYIKGTTFKVQMGAYKNHDLSAVLENNQVPEAFEQESKAGLNIFTIRHFRNYWKANKFKKELRKLGIKDAYIVCFVDGKRVPLKSVLDQVRAQKQ